MNSEPGSMATVHASTDLSEALPDMISTAQPMIERGALEAYRAYEEGLLAEVPNALEAYIHHQRFNLI